MLVYWYLTVIGLITISSTIYASIKMGFYTLGGYAILGYLLGAFILLSGICIGCVGIEAITPSVLYTLFPFAFFPLLPTICKSIDNFKDYISRKRYQKKEKKIRKQKEEELKKQQREKELNKLITNSKIKLYL